MTAPPSHRPPRRAPRRRRRIPLPVARALALAVVVALVAGIVALATGGEPRAPATSASATSQHERRASRPLIRTGPPIASPAMRERCFGAAAHDPARRCVNPALRLVVTPPPDRARAELNARCVPVGQTEILLPCEFGVSEQDATGTFALIGDSHASHWRGALERVARAKGWRGVTLTRTGCPFSQATALLRGRAAEQCVRWNHAVVAWLRTHPEVRTVFVSQHSGGRVLHAPSRSAEATRVAGYLQAWTSLPRTVQQIFVIRDTPRNTRGTAACVAAAVRARRPPGIACAVPRRSAVRPDPAAVAARRLSSPRVRLMDATRYMCSPRLCLPVIGGALVHKDIDHLTQTFATTLAPYFLKRIDAVLSADDAPTDTPTLALW
jgi:hypothetical protein